MEVNGGIAAGIYNRPRQRGQPLLPNSSPKRYRIYSIPPHRSTPTAVKYRIKLAKMSAAYDKKDMIVSHSGFPGLPSTQVSDLRADKQFRNLGNSGLVSPPHEAVSTTDTDRLACPGVLLRRMAHVCLDLTSLTGRC